MGVDLISSLDDKCLYKVFEYLSITDVIYAQKVCKRWKTLFQESWKTVNQLSSSKHEWCFSGNCGEKHQVTCANDLEIILNFCGRYIKILNINGMEVEFPVGLRIPLLVKFCNNLEILSIENVIGTIDDELTKLIAKNQKLKSFSVKMMLNNTGKFLEFLPEDLEELELYCILGIDESTATFLFNKLNCLRSFSCNLCNWIDDDIADIITGKKTITKLSIEGSHALSSEFNMVEVFDPDDLEILTELYLGNNYELDDDDIENFTDSCKQLIVLDVSNCPKLTDDGIADIANLPKLEKLYIQHLKNVTDKPIGNLPDTLEFLSCKGCKKIKNHGVIKLLKRALKLSKLNLMECSAINIEKLMQTVIDMTMGRMNNIICMIIVDETLVKNLSKKKSDSESFGVFQDILETMGKMLKEL